MANHDFLKLAGLTAGVDGPVIGEVEDNKDPAGLGRVRVRFPWMTEGNITDWASIATLLAGPDHGTWFLPDKGQRVLVIFGYSGEPYVIGALWHSKARPPADNADDKNSVRMIRLRSGYSITFSEEPTKESVEISDPEGELAIRLDTATRVLSIKGISIDLTASEQISLKAPSVIIDATKEGSLTSDGNLTIGANQKLTLIGSERVEINP